MRILFCIIFGLLTITPGAPILAQSQPTSISLSLLDVNGAKLSVPTDQKISILAFVRADQPQSREALATLKSTVPDGSAQVIVIVSGPSAPEQVKQLAADRGITWPLVADPEFATSGSAGVHVWPTTVIVQKDGQQAAHLAGMPISYASDLQAHLDHAQSKIDNVALEQRLNHHAVVGDDAAQMADRHLQIAQRLLETNDPAKAREQLDAGLKLQPKNPKLLMTLAKVLVLSNQMKDAQEVVDRIDPRSVPQWQIDVLRGRIFVHRKSGAMRKRSCHRP